MDRNAFKDRLNKQLRAHVVREILKESAVTVPAGIAVGLLVVGIQRAAQGGDGAVRIVWIGAVAIALGFACYAAAGFMRAVGERDDEW